MLLYWGCMLARASAEACTRHCMGFHKSRLKSLRKAPSRCHLDQMQSALSASAFWSVLGHVTRRPC